MHRAVFSKENMCILCNFLTGVHSIRSSGISYNFSFRCTFFFYFLKLDLVTCTYCWWSSMEYFFNILGAIIGVTFWQLYKQRDSGSSPGVCSKLEKEHERWRRHHDWGVQRRLRFLHALQGLCPIRSETGVFAASPWHGSERTSCENTNTIVLFS